MFSLINDRIDRNNIKNCNLWSYSLISIKDLEDKIHNCCYSHIKPEIIKNNLITIDDDIRTKLLNTINK